MGEGTRRQAARAPGSMRLLLQPGRLAQFVGPVGLLPRERGGGLLLAGAVGVADLLGLAAEVTVAGGALVDRVHPVRSEERRVGQECDSECRSRGSTETKQKNNRRS